MQTQSNRNAYFRIRYAMNIEKERERQREKYYRTRKLLSDLTEEEIEIKREKNRINYEKWRIRQGKEVKERKPETQFKKPIKQRKLKTHNMVPKKIKLPERMKHKYVSDVLRKFPKSRLCDILISDWKISDLQEFERLEKLLTEKQ